jgi:hypothetical protein
LICFAEGWRHSRMTSLSFHLKTTEPNFQSIDSVNGLRRAIEWNATSVRMIDVDGDWDPNIILRNNALSQREPKDIRRSWIRAAWNS